MSDQQKTRKIDTADGTFYVQIRAAERKTYGSTWSEGGVREEIKGRLRVATDPEFEGRVTHGLVKVRGRAYALEHTAQMADEAYRRHSGDAWSNESTYSGGYRNDKGQSVKYEAKAYDVLRAMEHAALDKFAEENSDWERESTRLLFEQERDRALREKRRLELEADQEDIKAAQWQKRIDDLMGVSA